MQTISRLNHAMRFKASSLVRLLIVCFVLLGFVLSTVYTYTRVLTPAPASAATSTTLNYQGRLFTSGGATVPDGYYNIQFRLYDASSGGTNLWTETWYDSNGAAAGNDNRVRVVNGYMSVNLGAQNPFPAMNWDRDLFLTLNIGGSNQTATPTYDGEMTPRIKLTGVPFAFQAGAAAKLEQDQGTYSGLLEFDTLTADRRFLLPDTALATTGSPATICVFNGTSTNCPSSGGSGNYIQNGTALQTAANFNIQAEDNGTSGTIGGIIRGAAAGQTVDLLQLQASNGAILAAFNSSGQLVFGPTGSQDTNLYRSAANTLRTDDSFAIYTDSATAFQVRNAAGTNTVLAVDTSSSSVLVQGAGGLRIGVASTTTGTLQFANAGSTFFGTLQTASLGQATTFTLPDPGQATASICLSTGNCAGSGGGVTTTGGTAGQVAFFSGAQQLQGSNNLFWDTTNNRLGIGTNNPNYRLDVSGTINAAVTGVGVDAIRGDSGSSIGVYGRTGGASGVRGGVFGESTGSAAAVYGLNNNNTAILGFTQIGTAGYFTQSGSSGASSSSNLMSLIRDRGGTGNLTGDLLYVQDNPTTTGTVSGNLLNLVKGTSTVFRVANNGAVLMKNSSDAIGAFDIQNASGASLLNVDTTGSGTINVSAPIISSTTIAGTTINASGNFAMTGTQMNNGHITKGYQVGSTGVATNDVVVLASETGNPRAITSTTARDVRVLGVSKNTVAANGGGANIAIGGNYEVTADTGAVAIGDQLVVSSTAGRVTVDNTATTGILGYAVSAKAGGSSGLVNVFIRPVNGQSTPIYRNSTDSTTAFRIQEADTGENLFVADTANMRIAVGPSATPANGVLTVGADTTTAAGGMYFGTDTSLYRSAINTLFTGGDFRTGGNTYASSGNSSQVFLGNIGSGAAGILFGQGASQDVNLWRESANILRTDDQFKVNRTNTTDTAFRAQIAVDTNPRWMVEAGGTLRWGDGTAATDVNLYRSAAGVLKTDSTMNFGSTTTAQVDASAGYFRGTGVTNLANTGAYLTFNSSADVLTVLQRSAGTVAMNIRGASGQTADLLQFRDNAGTVLTSFQADGKLVFGPSGSQDTNLYRSAADTLRTDDTVEIGANLNLTAGNSLINMTNMTAATNTVFRSAVAGDTSNNRFVIKADGGLEWGSGASARDTTLYRSAADTLRTNDNFVADGNLSINGTGNSYIMGPLGLGTANPQAASALTIANGKWIAGVDAAGTGFVNMFSVNSNNEILVGAALNIDGGIVLPTSGGQLTFADMPIDAGTAVGTDQSYTFRIGSTNALTVFGEADGTGGAQNVRVAVGSSIIPQYTLDVGGDINTTGVYRVNGTQISSANLSNDSNLAKLNASQTFTGQNTFRESVNNGIVLQVQDASNDNLFSVNNTSGFVNIGGGSRTGTISFSRASTNAVQILSGNNSLRTAISMGRAATDVTLGVVGAGGEFVSGSSVGDVVLRSETLSGRRLYVNNGGTGIGMVLKDNNFGIGTADPGYKFDVQGGTGITGRFSGRVIGANAVNTDEFLTLGQANGLYASGSGSNSYIQNGTSQQTGASFNIDGTGTVAGAFSAASINTGGTLRLNNTGDLSNINSVRGIDGQSLTIGGSGVGGGVVFQNTNASPNFLFQNSSGGTVFAVNPNGQYVCVNCTSTTSSFTVKVAAGGTLTESMTIRDSNDVRFFEINKTGAMRLQNTVDSTEAFRIQKATTAENLMVADTSNMRLAVGPSAIPANGVLTVGTDSTTNGSGGLYFGTDTNLYRNGVGILRTDSQFRSNQSIFAQYNGTNQMKIGDVSGNAGLIFGAETNFSRTSAGVLNLQSTGTVTTLNISAGTAQGSTALQNWTSGAWDARISGTGDFITDGDVIVRDYGLALGDMGGSTRGLSVGAGANGYIKIYGSSSQGEFTIQGMNSATRSTLAIQGMASQTGDLFQLKDSAGVLLTAFQADGKLVFGQSGSQDTNLYRTAANHLRTDSRFSVNYNGGKSTLSLVSTGTDTGLTIGSDTTLYRSAANTLATDDSFSINTNSTSALKVEQSGVNNNTLVVDTANGRIGVNRVPTTQFDVSGSVQIVADSTSALQIRNTGNQQLLHFDSTNRLLTLHRGNSATSFNPSSSGTLQFKSSYWDGAANVDDYFKLQSIASNTYQNATFNLITNNNAQVFRVSNIGSTTFQNSTDTSSAFQLQNASSQSLFTADTSNRRISLDDGQAALANLFVLDSSSAAPTGVNGGMYYDTTLGKFRCYESNAWLDCVGAGAGGGASTMQDTYNNSTNPELTLNATNGALTIRDASTALGANLLEVQNNAGTTSYMAVAAAGTTIRTGANSDNALQVLNTSGAGIFNVRNAGLANSVVGINLGATDPQATLDVAGTLRLGGTGQVLFTTPVGSTVGTKINIPVFDPGASGQILAFGLPSTAQPTSRAISVFDARTGAHQPTVAVFSPDENNAFGFSWEGSNSNAYLKTTAGDVTIRSNTTDIATFESSGNVAIARKLTLNGSGAPTTSADGIQLGSDVNLYRAGSQLLQTTSQVGIVRSAAGNIALATAVPGDISSRFELQADGRMTWTNGAGSSNVSLYRTSGGSLQADNQFGIYRTNGTDGAFAAAAVGDTQNRLQINVNGLLEFGPGNAALDTNLYRSAANTLRTDDAFTAVGLITGTGGLNISGGDASINSSSNFNTQLNTGTSTGMVTIGNSAAGTISLQSGSAINIGTGANAQTVAIGNTTGASALNLSVGTGNFTLNGVGASTYTLGASTTTGTISIGGTAQTGAISVGTGTGVQTLNFGTGGTGAKTVTVGSTASTSSLTLNSGTGAINIGTTAQARTVNVGTGAAAQTVNVGSTNGASTTTIQAGTGALNIQNQGTGAIGIGNNAVNSVINIGKTGSTANTTTVNIATSTGAAQTVNLGSTNGASAVVMNAGTGGIALNGATNLTVASIKAFNIGNALGESFMTVDTGSVSNLVVNGGFETGTGYWSTVSGSTLTQNTTVTNSHQGQGSAQIATPATAGAGMSTTGFIVAVPAGTYNLVFYAKSDTGSFSTLGAGYNQGAGDVDCTLSSNTVSSDGFRRYSCTFTSTANLQSVYVKQTDATARTFYIDQLTLSANPGEPINGNIYLQGTVAGATVFKNHANSTSAFKIQNAARDNLFNVDTLNRRITLDDGQAALANLFVLDSSSAAPTGVNGGMYYDSTLGKFRCYQNSAWVDCVGKGSVTLQDAYDAGASGTITTTSSSKDIMFRSGIGNDSTTAFMVQNSVGNNILWVDTVNGRVNTQGAGGLMVRATDGTNNFQINSTGDAYSKSHYASTRASAGNNSFLTYVGAEVQPRFQIQADGTMQWSNGTNPYDVDLYRSGVGILKTTSSFLAVGSIFANQGTAAEIHLASGSGSRPEIRFGSTGDTNLYRPSADTLQTDDAFTAGGLITGQAGMNVTGGTVQNLETGGILCKAYDDTLSVGAFGGRQVSQWRATTLNFTDLNPAGQADQYSIRCAGYIKSTFSESYTFYVNSNDGYRLWVDGKKVVHNYTDGIHNNSGTVYLNTNRWVPILIEHYENTGSERFHLEWQSTNQARQTVPATAFAYSGSESAPTLHGTAYFMGNVGIGNINPKAELHVATNETNKNTVIRLDGGVDYGTEQIMIEMRESSLGAYDNGFDMGYDSGTNEFYLQSSNGGTLSRILTAQRTNGKIGIGRTVASTQALVEVNGQLRVTHGANASTDGGGSFFASGFSSANGQAQYVGNWNNANLWGIGAFSGSSSDNTIRIGNVDGTAAAGTSGVWSATQNINMVLGGSLGLGTTSAPAAKLEVAGGDIRLDNNYGIQIKDSAGTARDVLIYSTANNLQLKNIASTGSVQIENRNNGGSIQLRTGSANNLVQEITGAGAVTFTDRSNTATAFRIQNASSQSLFTADTSNRRISLDDEQAALANLFVLDSSSAAPTGVNGGMYYDTTLGKFRCYQAGGWLDCVGAGAGSSTLQNAYDASSSPATIVTTSATKDIIFRSGVGFDSASLFQIQNASSQTLFVADTQNQRVAVGPAAVPANGVLTVGTNTTAASGGIWFGTDTNLYRSGVAELESNSGLTINKASGDSVLTIEADRDNNPANEDSNPVLRFLQDGSTNNLQIGVNGTANARFTGALANTGYMLSPTATNRGLQFAAGGEARITLDSAGNVGFGTNSPFNAGKGNLHLWGTGTNGANAKIRFGDTLSTNNVWIGENGTTDTDILHLHGKLGIKFTIDTAATVTPLEVEDDGDVMITAYQDNYSTFTVRDSAQSILLNVNSSQGFVAMNGVTEPGNELQNGSFEFDTSIARDNGWFITGNASVANNSTQARSGNRYLSVNSAGSTHDVGTAKRYQVNPGDDIYFEGWVKNTSGTNGTGGFWLGFTDKDNTNTTFVNSDWTNPGTTWTRRVVKTTVPAGRYYVTINSTVRSDSSTGTWHFDDLYMRKSSEKSNQLFRNSVDASDSFRIQNASSQSLFTADTSNRRISLDDEQAALANLFVLDSSSAAPTGVNGGMYYDTTLGKFRCFENGIWKDCIGGNNIGTTTVRKNTNESVVQNTTLQNDDELSFPVAANETWTFRFTLNTLAAAAANWNFNVTSPSGSVCSVGFHNAEQAVSEGAINCGTSFMVGVESGSSTDLIEITGSIANGSTAGNVTLQWAQNTSNTNTSYIYAGSYLVAQRVGQSTGANLTTLQGAYDNSSSPATITTSSAAKNVVIRSGSGFDSTGAFSVQNSSGSSVLWVDTQNGRVNAQGAGGLFVRESNGTANILLQSSGSASFNGNLTVTRATAGNNTFVAQVTGDTNPRFQIAASGLQQWGAGGVSALDTNLYRETSNALKTDGWFTALGFYVDNAPDSTSTVFRAKQNADSQYRYTVRSTGQLEWGSGTAAWDTNLYRSGAGILKTDGALRSGAGITVSEGSTGQVFMGNASGAATITFGQTGTARLYHSAADTLKTDDSLHVQVDAASALLIQNSTNQSLLTADTQNHRLTLTMKPSQPGDILQVRDSSNNFRWGINNWGGMAAQLAASTDWAYEVNASGDTSARFVIRADGEHLWGNGTAARDVNLFRASADVLRTDDAFQVGGQLTVGAADTTGTLLVLDTKTDLADPTGVNGGMYYNSATGMFRCFVNSAWQSCGPQTKKLAADVTHGQNTFANVTGMSFSVAANTDYQLKCNLVYQTVATTTGIRFGLSGPASPTSVVGQFSTMTSATAFGGTFFRAYDTGTATTGVDAVNSDVPGTLDATFRNGANAGTLQLRLASEVNASQVTARTGSSCMLTQL